MQYSEMNEKFDTILLNLKIIASIPRNGRIRRTPNGSITLESDSIMVPVKRFIYRDDRKQAILDINCIINEAFAEIKSLLASKHISGDTNSEDEEARTTLEKLGLVYSELERASIGIENLKTTYQTDIPVTSQIDIVLNKIESCMNEVRRKCPNVQENIPVVM